MSKDEIQELVPRHDRMTDDVKMGLAAIVNGATDIHFQGEKYEVICTDHGTEAIIRIVWIKTEDD